MDEKQIAELIALAAVEGISLPYAPALIIAMEKLGAVVDLETGEIVLRAADRRCYVPGKWAEGGL